MKKLNKLMAIGLSLVMCLGMIAPAFATDAYFYGKDEDTDTWVFLGKGEVNEDTANDQTDVPNEDGSIPIKDIVDEDGQLTDNATAPKADSEDGTQTIQDDNGNDVVVKPFDDINGTVKGGDGAETEVSYEYDDGEGDVGQYTYTVEWDDAKWTNGAGMKDENGEYVELVHGGPNADTVHVDGTIVKHENAQVTVVVKNVTDKNENGTTYDGNGVYVRDSVDNKDHEDVKSAIDKIVETIDSKDKLTEENYHITVQGDEKVGYSKEYKEKTYTVTYRITGNQNSGVDVSGLGSTNGKATQAWSENMLKEVLTTQNTGAGSYSFSGWTYAVDEKTGNVTVTANCTFTPYYYDYDLGDTDVTIDDQAVPLAAGPVTRAQFIDYLWRHEGEPDSEGVCTFTDVEDTHEHFDALCWAEENGVAEAYLDAEGHEDGTFEPDELVTVAAVREFLDNFAGVFGTNAVAVADLTTLTGEDGEAVLNCDQVLAEFFGEEYELPEDLDALETDDAA